MPGRKLFNVAVFALVAVLAAGDSFADDIDIYLTNASGVDSDEPMVMFSIDWRPNLSATVCNGSECDSLYADGYLDKDPQTETVVLFELLTGVLKKVFDEISGVKVGLMITHDTAGGSCAGPQSGNNECTNGGFIASGFRSLQKDDANGEKAAFIAKLGNMPLPQGNLSHKYQAAELFFEFYRYLTGGDVYNGHNGYRSFDGSQDDPRLNLDEEHPEFSWDESIETRNGRKYESPLSARGLTGCGSQIYTINIMFGTINADADSDAAIQAARSDGGMGITLPGNNNDRFSTILSFLNTVDLRPDLPDMQNVTSYFLVPSANNTEHSFARAGGSVTALQLSDDPEELYETIIALFQDILSVSTTFVSASVPVNVYNRAEMLDHVYLGLFQPMPYASWPGNLKKLTLDSSDITNVFLVDAEGAPAVAVDGRIKYDALTHWTDAATLPYPDANVVGDEADYVVDGKDGRFVPRGGAGQHIAGSGPGLSNSDDGARQLYTEPLAGSTLTPLNADPGTALALLSALGVADSAESLCLLRHIRGYQIDSALDCAGQTARPWLLGSVLHSRPLALNYGGSSSDPDIRIVLGSNNGFLHMFRNTKDGAQSGEEVWAFMPRAVMPQIEPQINTSSAGEHVYGVDGEISAYMLDNNKNGSIESGDGDKIWIFFGLRRGGKAYYALDLTDPDRPKFLWSRDKNDSGFGELGMTFSQPAVDLLDWGNGVRPVLVFGAGYDEDKDQNPVEDDDEGNALFIVDAETGDLVWKAVKSGGSTATEFAHSDLRDSIPSAVTVLDSDGDQLLDRVYVGDSGGVLWRADLPGDDRANWSINPVLTVGRHAGSEDRRFFHAPDVALSQDDSGSFDAVVIGSGDRASPLDRSLMNEFYMLKDRNTAVYDSSAVDAGGNPVSPPTLYNRSDLADMTDNCRQDEDVDCADGVTLERGWRLSLEGDGEKSLSTPLTLAGAVYFTTYLPPDPNTVAQCGQSEGGGLLYTVSLHTAGAVQNRNIITDNDGGGTLQKEDRVETLDSGGIPSQVVVLMLNDLPPETVPILRPDLNVEYAQSRLNWKTFWHHKQD